ncbi:glycosyltransferase [Clostridium sp. B9]|uniref:glycosyltransferase n=1 Tax=Clostridium sp. B9 TaxID=3423224 RepID=UPI003D2EB9EE
MQLLFLIDNLCGGGAEKVLIDIIKNLNSNKYDVELFLIRNKGVYLQDVPKNIKVNYIYNDKLYEKKKMYKIYYLLTKIHFKINRMLGLGRLFKKNIKKKYDVYIPFLEGACIQLISDSDLSEKKIAWIHTDLMKHNIMKLDKERKALEAMDKLVCVSEASKISLITKHPEFNNRVTVINNPIDLVSIDKKANEEICYEKIFNNNNPTFIAIGRVEKVKGHDLLIEAHKKLINEGINHNIAILGTGGELNNLEKIIKNESLEKSFKFLGFESNPYKYLKKADFYIMPSRYEGYPLSLCEAIALEKPIIATNFESANDILKNGKLGLIAEIEDIEDIACKMKEVLQDKNLATELQKNCRVFKNKLGFEEKIIEIEDIIDN